jgi:putative FmdB family regulatory protein
MPIYEYQCEGCGEVFELIQKFSDEPLKVHEKCGAPVHRMITSSAIQFKGSGWYATDYGKGSNGSKKSDSEKSEKSEKKDSGDASSKSESKTESKSGESKPASSEKSKSD